MGAVAFCRVCHSLQPELVSILLVYLVIPLSYLCQDDSKFYAFTERINFSGSLWLVAIAFSYLLWPISTYVDVLLM